MTHPTPSSADDYPAGGAPSPDSADTFPTPAFGAAAPTKDETAARQPRMYGETPEHWEHSTDMHADENLEGEPLTPQEVGEAPPGSAAYTKPGYGRYAEPNPETYAAGGEGESAAGAGQRNAPRQTDADTGVEPSADQAYPS